MAITKPTKKTADNFIAQAPDATPSEPKAVKGVFKGNKRQITLTIAPDLLEKIDAMAEKYGQARAALINLAIYQAVEREFK